MASVSIKLAFFIYLCLNTMAKHVKKRRILVTFPRNMTKDKLSMDFQWKKGGSATAAILPSSGGLESLISAAYNLKVQANLSRYVLSFNDDENTNSILKETSPGKTFIQVGMQMCRMRQSVESNILSSCLRCKQAYIETLLSLLRYLNSRKIAIMTSKGSIYDAFSDVLYTKLKREMSLNEGEHVIQRFEFGSDPFSIIEISHVLYDLNYFEAAIVIMIANEDVIDMVFKAVGKYEALRRETIWLLIEFNQERFMTKMPAKAMNLCLTEEEKLGWNEKKISDTIANISKMLFDGINIENSVQSAMKCGGTTEIHFSSIMQLRNDGSSEWIVISRWEKRSGLEITPMGKRWLEVLSTSIVKSPMRVVCVNDKPFTFVASRYETKDVDRPCHQGIACKVLKVKGNITTWIKTCCTGHSIDLLQLLANDLNFEPHVYIVKDGFYGSNKNGTWNGIIGELIKAKADLAATQLTITKARSKIIDFTAPYNKIRHGILMLNKRQRLDINLQFLSFLDTNLLWAFIGLFLNGFLFIYFYECISMRYQGRLHDCTSDTKSLWMETFTYVSGITFQRDLGGRNPKGVAARLAAIVAAFGMVIAMTAYTAVLTATKVVHEERQPFKGIHDERLINPTHEFKFATVNSTAIETYFKESQSPTVQRMHRFMMKYNTRDTEEGINKVLSGELQGIINEWHVLQYHVNQQRDCSLQIFDLQIVELMHGFAVPKGSKWKDMISRRFIRYMADEVIMQINKKWLGGSCHDSKDKRSANESYQIRHFIGLLLGLLGAIAILGLLSVLSFAFLKRKIGWFELSKIKPP